MNFYPSEKDTLFYVTVREFSVASTDRNGVTTLVKSVDRSYCDQIFKLMASDDYMVVALPVVGGYSTKPKLFKKQHHIFTPVGPEVAKVLGLHDE